MLTAPHRLDVEQRVCQVAADQAGAGPDAVRLDTHLFVDLGFDSLDALEFSLRISEEFDVGEIPESVSTLRQVVDFVMQHAGEH